MDEVSVTVLWVFMIAASIGLYVLGVYVSKLTADCKDLQKEVEWMKEKLGAAEQLGAGKSKDDPALIK